MMSQTMFLGKTGLYSPSGTPDPLLLTTGGGLHHPQLLGDESCSEVSSSSPAATSTSPQSPPGLVNIGNTGLSSPFGPTELTDVDLNFWELAINSTSPTLGFGTPSSSVTSIGNSKPFIFTDDGSPNFAGRDDLSPASSINSFGADSIEKKKKGSLGRQSEELCLVCGDRASGYHYNALTCEGCKGFFRRSITKNAVYTCKYGKNCEMDMYMRRKCQECRFKKCISVGMRPECVVPEHTCQVKREQKKAKDKDKQPSSLGSTRTDSSKQQNFLLQLGNGLPSPLSLPSTLKSCGRIELTKEHQELINRLINNQEEFESPPDNSVNVLFTPDQDKMSKYYQITEMTKVTVELIVQFALKLPGFVQIPVEDQVTLLKACTSELIVLRASRRYHMDTDSIVFANNSPCTREFYISAGMDVGTTDALFNFCKKMASMKVDNAEYALLSGITIFSERPSLLNPTRVERIQYLYVETLYAYVTNKWAPKSGMMVAKLLDVLTQLRSLGIMNNEQCETFLNSEKELPELLAEIWDINKRNT